MKAHFRTGTPADVPDIRRVVRAAYAKWVPVIGREPSPMVADYDQKILDHRFDLVEENGQLVALIETALRPGHLWIDNIAVDPSAQHRGLGRSLLAHAEVLARDAGLAEVQLLTNGKMLTNIELYQRTGYVLDREEPWNDGKIVYMVKKLSVG